MKCVVLETCSTDRGDVSWDELRRVNGLDVIFFDYTSADQIEKRAYDADLIVLNKLTVDAHMLSKVPKCRAIFLLATGYNNVVMEDCNNRGVAVYNVEDYSSTSVAQHVLAMIMDRTNRVSYYYHKTKEGVWSAQQQFCYYDHTWHELGTMKLGVLGFGNIGQMVASTVHALGMDVLVHTRTPKETQIPVTYVDLAVLFASCDFVSIHVPLTPDTEGLVGKHYLTMMKPYATLINTARGVIINEEDLVDWLLDNPNNAAYIDVMSTEPPPTEHRLYHCSNCIITPHMSWTSLQSRQKLINKVADNVSDFLFNEGKLSLNYSNFS